MNFWRVENFSKMSSAICLYSSWGWFNIKIPSYQLRKSHCLYSSGGWFNTKIPSHQYRKSLCGDKTISRPSYLHNGISYTGKTTSLYWIRAQVTMCWYELYWPDGKGQPVGHQWTIIVMSNDCHAISNHWPLHSTGFSQTSLQKFQWFFNGISRLKSQISMIILNITKWKNTRPHVTHGLFTQLMSTIGCF